MIKKLTEIGLVYREDSPDVLTLARTLYGWAQQYKINVYTPADQIFSGLKPLDEEALNKLDLVVALGGDGTYLRAVHIVGGRPIPCIGAKLGHTGFLTEAKTEELLEILEDAIDGDFQIKTRAMFDVTIKKRDVVEQQTLALNDVVIERGGFSHLIEMTIFQGNSLVSRFRADGLIIATPTGTTAYNLSAGGPIIHPSIPAIVVTPICPHSLTSRSITLPDSEPIRIRLHRTGQKAHWSVDGRPGSELSIENDVIISRSKREHFMLTSRGFDYFEQLNQKLQFGQRG